MLETTGYPGKAQAHIREFGAEKHKSTLAGRFSRNNDTIGTHLQEDKIRRFVDDLTSHFVSRVSGGSHNCALVESIGQNNH